MILVSIGIIILTGVSWTGFDHIIYTFNRLYTTNEKYN